MTRSPTAGGGGGFQIFIKDIKDGVNTVTLDGVSPLTTVAKVKSAFQAKTGKPCVRLNFGGHELEGERTLESYGITKESTLHMLMRPQDPVRRSSRRSSRIAPRSSRPLAPR